MYGFNHDGKVYGPDGVIADVEGTPLKPEDTDLYNKAVEAQEIAWLQTHPEKVTLYMRKVDTTNEAMARFVAGGWDATKLDRKNFVSHKWVVGTWLGTVISDNALVGSRQIMGFQSCYRGGSYRRAVTCKIFGVTYHGWYMESSGDYVRLKKAKRQ